MRTWDGKAMGVRTRPENWATFHSFSDGNTEAGTHPAREHFPEASSPPSHHKPPDRRLPQGADLRVRPFTKGLWAH